MPLLCMKCDTRVESSLAKPGTFWCPGCEKELGKDDVYKVGKRYFASGIGMMMAMAAAVSTSLPKGDSVYPFPHKQSKEVANTLAIAQRQKRKKIYGLKKKQRRHDRQMRRR